MEMGFTQAIKTCLSKYATFSGRAPRSEYWWFALFITLVYLAFMVFAQVMGEDSAIVGIAAIPFVIFVFAIIIPSIAVSVRRLHDLDQSGWFFLLALIPVVGSLGLAIWFCFKGTEGANRFGPDPLGGA